MSMPAHRGLTIGPASTPFNVLGPSSTGQEPDIIEEEDAEAKNEPNSLVEETKKLKVGSFTCFQVMSGPPLKTMESSPDNKDAASATSQQTASTFASAEDNDVAPEPSDDEEADEGLFDME